MAQHPKINELHKLGTAELKAERQNLREEVDNPRMGFWQKIVSTAIAAIGGVTAGIVGLFTGAFARVVASREARESIRYAEDLPKDIAKKALKTGGIVGVAD